MNAKAHRRHAPMEAALPGMLAAQRWGLGLLLTGATALAAMAAPAPQDPAAFIRQVTAAVAALPAAPACTAPTVNAAGLVTASPLPGVIEGDAQGTTGGLGKRRLMVTSADDGPERRPPMGSLRWAVEEARSGGGWITFAPAMAGRSIHLERNLRLPSDITIDGGCGGVTLTATQRTTILDIREASNIILAGLTLSKDAYSDEESLAGDAIGMTGYFDRIAVLHNAFRRCGDGCIDIVRKQAVDRQSRVTVAYNHFADHNKVMLIGTLTCYVDKQAPGCDAPLDHLSDSMSLSLRVTVQANFFDGTSQRHPKVVTNAAVQLVNNVMVLRSTQYANGQDSAVYGAAAASGGMLAMRGNVVVNGTGRERSGGGPISATRDPRSTSREKDGAVSSVDNIAIGPVRMVEARPTLALAAINAPVVPVGAAGDPVRMAACVLRLSGPAGGGLSWPESCTGAP